MKTNVPSRQAAEPAPRPRGCCPPVLSGLARARPLSHRDSCSLASLLRIARYLPACTFSRTSVFSSHGRRRWQGCPQLGVYRRSLRVSDSSVGGSHWPIRDFHASRAPTFTVHAPSSPGRALWSTVRAPSPTVRDRLSIGRELSHAFGGHFWHFQGVYAPSIPASRHPGPPLCKEQKTSHAPSIPSCWRELRVPAKG